MSGLSPAKAMWLLARLRLLRLFNMVSGIRFGKAANTRSRAATRGKRSGRWVLGALVGAGMLASFLNLALNSVMNLHCKIDAPAVCARATDAYSAAQALAGAHQHAAQLSTALAAALTLQLFLMWLVSFLLPLGSRELAQADWDLEWLVTLPMGRGPLLWARLLERSVANPSGILALWPLCAVLAWYGHHGWASPLLGAAAALVLLMLAALVRTLADTGLRLSLPPSQLRNLQALASVLSMPLLYIAISFSIWSNKSFTLDWARSFPDWTLWTPPGLAVQALMSTSAGAAWQAAALLLAQAAVLLVAGMALLRFQLRHGVVATGARGAARRQPAAVAAALAAYATDGTASDGAAPAPRRRALITTLQRRELVLLGRDRNFLVQSLLIPVVLVLSQLLVNGQLSSIMLLGQDQQLMAAVAFGIGSYVLLLSAFQTLNTEGSALWMLYTFPRSMAGMLKEKAQLWGALALLYPMLVFATGLYFTPRFNWQLLAYAAIVAVGIPIYTLIAVSLGVFACDPLAQEPQARVRPTYSYLYLLLSSLYVYALYAAEWMQTLAIIILTASLAMALWQKAHDELPYLLDPAASPPARVSVSDGLIAATLFFVLQLLALGMLNQGLATTAQTTALAFAIAGSVVYALVRLLFWRHKTSGVPAILNAAVHGSRAAAIMPALRAGLAGAAVSAAFGIGYLWLMRGTPWLPLHALRNLEWLIPVSVLAAPVFEEFIFRGLVFGGLRRQMGALPAATGSAALFAIVHPAPAMVPVFVVGLATAWAYERSKSLLAPMLVHAVYNAVVTSMQMAR
jgi:membrane protease YdiL (CAAX protease family)